MLFDKLRNLVGSGLGRKNTSAIRGLWDKARNFINTGVNVLKSKPVDSIIEGVSQFLPSAGQYFNDAKRYGAIVSNMMNGGLEKKFDRWQKDKEVRPTIERVERVERRKPAQSMYSETQPIMDL